MAKAKSVKVYELEKELYNLERKLIEKDKIIKKIDREAQKKFMEYYNKTTEDFIKIFGKNYI